MFINNISNNSFKASFSNDATTQKILKQAIESNPYDVFEVGAFLERLQSKDVFSLTSENTIGGQKVFIQRNNEKPLEIKTIIKTEKSPIIDALKQLSYIIANGNGQFKEIFGEKASPIGDFGFHANQVVDKFINGADVQEYCDKINKLEQSNRALKSTKNKSSCSIKNVLMELELNNRQIARLKEKVSLLDKDFVRKSLKIK